MPATEHDRRWLEAAIALSRRCPESATAYAVGALVVDANGQLLEEGFSRDTDPLNHAEESVLARLRAREIDLGGATLYSSLEPCSDRKSREHSCTAWILSSAIRRVVFALREPPRFAHCRGAELLRAGGIEVIEVPELAPLVAAINAVG